MTEFGFRVLVNIDLDLVPISFIVPDLFAVGADGQKPGQLFHIGQGLPEFPDQIGILLFSRIPLI
jgi:hypothetical protein